MTAAVRILLVEDDEAHVLLIRRAFEEREDLELVVEDNLKAASEQIEAWPPDLLITDLMLPDGRGVELLPPTREETTFPTVIMTSHGDEKIAVEAIRAGALDYVVKSEATLAALPKVADRALREWEHIQERRRAEQALRASEERFRTFLRNSSEGIGRIEIDPPVSIDLPVERQLSWLGEHAVLVEANQALARSLGVEGVDQLTGRLPGVVRDLANQHRDVIERMVENGYRLEAVESRWKDEQGEPRFFLDSVSGEVEEDRVARLWWMRTDITERRLVEESRARQLHELARADKMIALGVLVSGVAHEISNPNQFIMLNLPVLQDAWRDALPILEQHCRDHPDTVLANMPFGEARQEVQELLDEILEGSHRIKGIVSDLREYAREDETRSEGRVDVNRVVQTSLRLVGTTLRKFTDHFRLELASEMPIIQGNTRQIEQVIVNLVLNACQALESREEAVIVCTEYDESAREIAIIVKDDGRGIAEEDLPHLADPFFTRKRDLGGTGLGLSVSARIVREHGGRLVFSSRSPKGTRARLVLPALDPPAQDGRRPRQSLIRP